MSFNVRNKKLHFVQLPLTLNPFKTTSSQTQIPTSAARVKLHATAFSAIPPIEPVGCKNTACTSENGVCQGTVASNKFLQCDYMTRLS